MRFAFLCLIPVLVAACGRTAPDSAASNADVEAKAAALSQQRIEVCVSSAMLTISGQPSDNISVLSRVRQFDLANCPGDFSGEFVGLRQAFESAISFEKQLAQHKQAGGEAVGSAVVVGFAEWLFNTNSGITPFRDWVRRDRDLNARAESVSNSLRNQYDMLERTAARYGHSTNKKVVLLIQGEDPQGTSIFAFTLMTTEKAEAWMSAQRSGRVLYPEEYGQVVLSGRGTPSDQDFARMKREYGFNQNSMSNVR
jgi:hypothetical protein